MATDKKKILYLSYNGLLEPILFSQAIPYMKKLAVKHNIEYVLLTWEKPEDIMDRGEEYIKQVKDELKEIGIDWQYKIYTKSPRFVSTFYDLFVGIVSSFSLIKKNKIKLVHARGITPGVIPLFLKMFVSIKVIFDMRGLLAEEYAGGRQWGEDSFMFRIVKWVEMRMHIASDAICVLTNMHYNYNIKLDYWHKINKPMEVVPCCVDEELFCAENDDEKLKLIENMKAELKLDNKFVVLYPGKLTGWYLVAEMLDFFKVMLDKVPESVFLVVTRDDPSEMLRMANERSIPEEKIVVKSAQYHEMPLFIGLSDVSLFYIEAKNKLGSSPIKLGEVLSVGVPVITNTGVGDCDEIINDNKVGVVTTEFNANAYNADVDKVLALLKQSELADRCKKTAHDNLSLDLGVKNYSKIYSELLT